MLDRDIGTDVAVCLSVCLSVSRVKAVYPVKTNRISRIAD